jgi:hypothetical protein
VYEPLIFFGRNRLTTELLAKLSRKHPLCRSSDQLTQLPKALLSTQQDVDDLFLSTFPDDFRGDLNRASEAIIRLLSLDRCVSFGVDLLFEIDEQNSLPQP